jgi:hypothetical protein
MLCECVLAVCLLFFRCRGRFQHQNRDFHPRRDHAWRIFSAIFDAVRGGGLGDQSQYLIRGQRDDTLA